MTDPDFDPIEIARAVERTRELRSSNKGRWKAVRDRLATEGVNPRDAAIGGLFSEDYKMETALILTRDGRVFIPTFEWSVDEEGEEMDSHDDAWLWNWKEVSPAAPDAKGAYAYQQALCRRILEYGR